MPSDSEGMIQRGLVRHLALSLRLVVIGSLLLVVLLASLFVLIVRAADGRSRTLLAAELDRTAGGIADALRPMLETATPADVVLISAAMEPYASSDRALGLFFTPAEGGAGGVYFIAGAPAQVFSEGESARLVKVGAFGDFSAACAPSRVDAAAAGDASLWAVVPVASPAGCWRLVTNRTLAGVDPSFLALPSVRAVGIAAAAAALLMITAAALALAQIGRLRRIADVGHAYAEVTAVDDATLLPQPANDASLSRPEGRGDDVSAQVLALERSAVDLSAAVRAFADTARARLGADAALLRAEVADGVLIDGRPDFVRTLLEDLTAPAFHTPLGPVAIVLAVDEVDGRRHAVLTVTAPRAGGDALSRLSLVKQFVAALGAAATTQADAHGAETVLLRFPPRSVTCRQSDVG